MKRAARSERLVSRQPGSSGARPRFGAPVVLIVDDSEDNRELFAMALGRLGYRIELAVDGLEGVERAQATKPSVILMDLAMPRMDGFEATRQLRTLPELATAYVIAVTAFGDSVTTQRALAAGCNEVLSKPCAPDVLVARVEAGMERSPSCARDAG